MQCIRILYRAFEQTATVFVYSVMLLGFIAEMEGVHCAVRTESLNTFQVNLSLHMAVPWLRRLVAGVSPQRPGFDPGSVRVRFIVDIVAQGTGCPPRRLLGFSSNIIPQMLQTHIHTLLLLGQTGEEWESSKGNVLIQEGENCVQKYSSTWSVEGLTFRHRASTI